MAAIGRVFRWQLASRVLPGPIALPYVDGTWLFATRGMTGATGNWYCGLHEVAEMAFVLHLLRPGDHFVDAGANVGSYTIMAGAKARVTAVEPIPSTYANLRRNVALNAFDDRVSCHRLGLSDVPGALRFTSGLDRVNHVLSKGENATFVEVPVVRLDDLIEKAEPPILIKLDVEGHELAVLRGAPKTLAHPDLLAVVMETNGSGARYGVSDDELRAEMARYGFAPYGYEPFERRLTDAAGSNGNTVFIRDRAAVEVRLRAASSFRLANGTI